MLEKDLLEILACPETHQPLRQAPPELLERVNARIASGELKNQGGVTLQVPLADALVREDGRVLYPVVDDVPQLLVESGVEIG